jgi:hypothetical protein
MYYVIYKFQSFQELKFTLAHMDILLQKVCALEEIKVLVKG